MSSQSVKQPRMTAEERREQLLDVTRRIVVEHGFHAVSIEAVARDAGVSRPIVYGHFNDLAGLLEALIDRESGRAIEQLASVLPRQLDEGDRVEQLVDSLRTYLEAARAEPETWTLVLMPPEGAPAMLRERIALARSSVVAELTDAINPGYAPGLESPDPELTALMLSAVSDESVRLMLTDAERYPPDRLLSHARWFLTQIPR